MDTDKENFNIDKKSDNGSAEELLDVIFGYMNELMETRDFSSTVNIITSLGCDIVGADRASFWFWDRRSATYWTLAAKGNSRITIDENTGIIGECISHNEIILSNSPYSHKGFNNKVDKETGYKTKSVLCMPVADTDGDVMGAFQVLNKIGPDGNEGEFSEADIKRLSLVAVYGGKMLESYLLYNEAMMDQLTGLRNRYSFNEYYNRKLVPVIGEEDIGIIMCDIDHFKNVNDTYGHNEGDGVLRFVADILRKHAGVDDVIIRWGGEEFIFILRKKSIDEARYFAEDVRKDIETSIYEGEGVKLSVTMSFGVTSLDINKSLGQNVKAADERLYEAKNTGRNKVVV